MVIDPQEAYRSLQEGNFLPFFQPLVVLRTGELKGFELLARWNHPTKGWISPEDFIPAAEHDGWIDALTEELLQKGFAAAVKMAPGLMLSVNISALQLHDLGLPERIRSTAELAGFSLEHLMIEVTESALADDLERALKITEELKAMGCKLALDDFGTGYSSLSHLRSLPFDELKVDRTFVGSMVEERESRKIVAAVVGLGQSLGLITVAEGVETLEEYEMLLWLGCEIGQGWLFGRPVPAEELAQLVATPRKKLPSRSSNPSREIASSGLDSLPAERFAQLQAIYDGAPVGLAFLDNNLRYMSVNRRLADMNGLPIENHLGRTLQDILPDLFPQIEPYIRRALQGESIHSIEFTRLASRPKDPLTVLASYEPARDEAGEVIGVLLAIVDVSALKVAEKAQQETEKHFRYMMELLPQIPWVIDPEGRATDVSQRWLSLTGMSGDEWKGFGWLDALHPEDRQPTIDAMNLSLKSGHPIDLEYRVRSPGSDWKRMRARGSPRIGKDGKVVCWYGCLEDIEEQLEYQRQKGERAEA